MALERDDVVQAAVRILDAYGLADLSMRRLAESLGVKAGALYWHVANKQTLLAAVADQILGELPVTVEGDPAAQLASWAHRLRDTLLSHRDSAELVATALASGLCQVDVLAAPRDILLSRGIPPAQAAWGASAVLHLVLGHVVEEQNAQLLGQLGVTSRADPDDEGFAHGVAALVAGLLADQPMNSKE